MEAGYNDPGMFKAIFRGTAWGIAAAGLTVAMELAFRSKGATWGAFGLIVGAVALFSLPGAVIMSGLLNAFLTITAQRGVSPLILRTIAVAFGPLAGYVTLLIGGSLLDPRNAWRDLANPTQAGLFMAPAFLGGVALGLGVVSVVLARRKPAD